MKNRQSRMFQTEDLPLFSSTSPRVRKPSPPDNQPALQPALPFTCRLCHDTGVLDQQTCWCAAGQTYRDSLNAMNGESDVLDWGSEDNNWF